MGEDGSFGPFEILGYLDRSAGLSVLARAVDETTGEPCVVEWFDRTFSADPARLRAFDRVARFLADGGHAGLAPVARSGVASGSAFLVHPWIEGATLRRLLEPGPEDPRPGFDLAGHLVSRICEALASVHGSATAESLGVLRAHGNVVAERVLVGLDGRVRLAGACTAQAVHEGERDPGVRLSLATRAPETLAGAPPSSRSDVYQAGLILYELLVGRPPFGPGTDLELSERVRAGEILPPRAVSLAVPEELESCALRALAREPELRYADAAEMSAALQRALRTHGLLSGRREVAAWVGRVLGDGAAALAPPAARRRPRKAPPSAAPPPPVIETVSRRRGDPSTASIEIDLEGGVEREDPTFDIDTGQIVRDDPPTTDLVLEGGDELQTEDIEAEPVAPSQPAAVGGATPSRTPPRAPPPKRQPAPRTNLTPPPPGASVSSQEGAPPSRPSGEPPAPPSRPSGEPPAAPGGGREATRRADPTPAGLQRKVGAKLAGSGWGRRVASTLEVRRGPPPQRILYGDSTEFPSGRDFLVVVGSAVETVARIGLVELEVHAAWETIEAARKELEVVDAELEVLASGMSKTVAEARAASKDPKPFGELAERVKAASLAAVAESRREEKTRVDRIIGDSEARISRATSELHQALGGFFATDPIELLGLSVVVESNPDATQIRVRFEVQQGISYDYLVDGAVTEGFRRPRRVSDFARGIELQVGLKKQFLRKNLVPETVRLDDLFIRRLEVETDVVRLRLASKHQDSPELFDIALWSEQDEPPEIRHRGQGEPGEPEEVRSEQAPEILARLRELQASLVELAQEPILAKQRRLVKAEVEGKPVVEGDLMFELAHRLALELGPTVAEIAKRSPSARELALKVEEAGGVRQERYLEKAKIAAAFDPLPDNWKQLLRVLHVA